MVTTPPALPTPGVTTGWGTGLNAYLAYQQRARSWDVRDASGIDLSGSSPSDTAFNSLLAGMDPGDVLFLPHGATIKLANRRDIATPITVEGNGATITQASTAGVFQVVTGGDGATFKNINAVGPSSSTFSTDSVFLRVTGTSGTYVTDVVLDGITASNWGSSTLWAQYGRRIQTRDVLTTNSVYAGQMFLSCEDLRLDNPMCDTLAGLAGESYPVAFTRDSSLSLANAPRTKHAQVFGGYAKNTTWEAIDTHAGVDIKVFGYRYFNTKYGVAFVGGNDTGGTLTYAPQDCWAFGCHGESNVSNGTAGDGYAMIGALGLEQASGGGFVGCTAIGYGTQSNVSGGSGAVRLAATNGVMVSQLRAVEPSPFAVAMSADNYDTIIDGVECVDAWSTSVTIPGAVGTIGNNNRASVSNVRMQHATKSATYLNKTGIYVNGTPTNVEFILGGGNDLSIATTPLNNFLAANLKSSIFGSKVGQVALTGGSTLADVIQAMKDLKLST